jgi:general secretion pathway protein G
MKKIIVGLVLSLFLFGCQNEYSSHEQAKRDTVCLKMKDLKKRLDMFTLDNGVYPDVNDGFYALIRNPDVKKYPNYRKKPYIKKLPKDSWGTPFFYIKKGDYDIEIISYAADKKKGGEGIGKDILFSECKK